MRHTSRSFPARVTAVIVLLGGCTSSSGGGDAGVAGEASVLREAGAVDARPADAASRPVTFGGARPVRLEVPANYDPKVPTPLVLVLHGYGATGFIQATFFGYRDLPKRERVLVLAPDGTEDSSKKLFWNATDACCNFDGQNVDDVAYLTGLVAEVSRHYTVDAKRVYAIGHSNGGYMAHRLACDRAGTFAAIVSLAGALADKSADCQPTDKVSVVQAHGDKDDVVRFEGGSGVVGKGKGPYPGAKTTVARWAALNGCGPDLTPTGETLDLDSSLAGSETMVARHACSKGLDVELWTIVGGLHTPLLTSQFGERTWQWLKAHPKL
ncbi:MAG: prolyl oligopeptidase family serine peptidase [Deltaproteobacteria bacterium]|nr:prolyl oligopeptidase family serine peptidase [Deltaproteobacteria bacterium]